MYVYLDNAATSRFKPAGVREAIAFDLAHSANSGRSGHADALNAGFKIENCREFLLRALGGEGSHSLIFTKSCTEALNLALFGYIKGGERVFATANDHNAVLRPLFELKRRGMISLEIVEQERDGTLSLKKIEEAAGRNDIAALGGICNVTGASICLEEAAKVIKKQGCKIIADGAQCVPLQKIDLGETDIDMLACPGHKGLHGVQGTGFLTVKNGTALRPLIFGGTGTFSNSVEQPADIPEGFEAGTQFAGGIAALHAGAKWSFDHADDMRKLYAKLSKTTLYNLKTIGCTVYCENCDSGIIAFDLFDLDSAYVADMLDAAGIACRSGLHCAPLVHRHFGTLNQGMVRISFGPDNTLSDAAYLSRTVEKIASDIKAKR